LKWAGALYLLWMGWQAVRPGASSPFEARDLAPDAMPKLLTMGFMTSVLNPKVAVFYLSVFPQFINPEHGSMFTQSIVLGLTQISVSFTVNLLIALFASGIAVWFVRNPLWLAVQRYVMGGVLAALAVRLMLEQRKTV
ncbi:MAG: LysE family translocator, partial [Pseudomonas sp.]|nr:LysE family translocator [Pseudomonas sp.]